MYLTPITRYCGLFDNHVFFKADIDDIWEATNNTWVLGNDRFKDKVEQLMDRQIQVKPRGGDRNSELF